MISSPAVPGYAAAGVTTFNGRSGVVLPAPGDYTAAQVGAQATSEKNAANGYPGLDASALLAPAQLPAPTTTTRGGIRLSTRSYKLSPISGLCMLNYRGETHAHSTSTLSNTAGTLTIGGTTGSGGKFSAFHVENTTTSGTASLQIGIWKVGATLADCVLLWSATGISVSASGLKSVAIVAGAFTVAGAPYDDGAGHFVVPDGEKLLVGVLALTASVTLRSVGTGNGVPIAFALSSSPFLVRATQTGLSGLPATLTGATVTTGNPNCFWATETY